MSTGVLPDQHDVELAEILLGLKPEERLRALRRYAHLFEDVATIELALGELSVRVITIDEVIASKEKLGRPKDTAALPALYATREALRRRKPRITGPG